VSSAAEKKIALFRSLFRGRDDVYAVRWKGKNGKSGYSPAGAMDWRTIHAARPEDRKKVARNTRMLQPLTDKAIYNHLIGKLTIGIYPLLPDETCWFLADAAAFAAIAGWGFSRLTFNKPYGQVIVGDAMTGFHAVP